MIESLRLRPGLMAAFFAGIVLVLGAGPAAAGTANTTMQVTAAVVNNCTVSATNMIFSDYTGVAEVTSSSAVSATCTESTPLTLTDDGGLNPDTSASRRQMMLFGGTDLLTYELHTDPGLAAEYFTTDSLGLGLTSFVTIYGVIRAGAVAPTGVYEDVVTWTLAW